jgi:two-component system, NtrC family, sensor histidine kinase KinB
LPMPVQTELEEVLRTGADHLPANFKTVHRFEINREERYFLSRLAGMRTPNNALFGVVVLLQDVTEFRLLEEIKTNLISTVSHELKTPLTSIRTVLLMLLEQTVGSLNPKQREMLEIASNESERLLRTLETLLDLTRFEEGTLGMRLEAAAPAELIQAAIEETRLDAAHSHITVRLEVDDSLPAVEVDRERIIHALSNLLGNAIKYSPAGSEILLRARMAEGEGVYFGILDQGPGVPQQYQSRIFDRFFRVPGNPMKGAGLGLSIAREFVRAHRGRIGVHSEPGKGSEFFFILASVPS